MIDKMTLFLPEVGLPIMDESVGERKIFYRLGESEFFDYANKNTVMGGMRLVNIIPRMTVEDQGFTHVSYDMLDKTVQYEVFEGNRYKIPCKVAMRKLIETEKVVMCYSEDYRIPTSIPYIVQASGARTKVFVNISDFVVMDATGKIKINQVRNYNAFMAVIFAACVAYQIVANNRMLPADIADCFVLTYANMLERVINSAVHMDPITQDKVRYLATKFALIQMYGTDRGSEMFHRYANTYFPKLTKMVTDSIDNTFKEDCFDKLSFFIDELKRLYPSMKGISEAMIYDKWIRTYGAATAMAVDYFGYHLYTICMVLFESPLISRMALEPIMEKNKGTELYKRLPQFIMT